MRALSKINLKDVLFLDIETSTTVPELEIDSDLFEAYKYKLKSEDDNTIIQERYQNEAALIPEFGRIVCISVGMLSGGVLKTSTFKNLDEKELILDFYKMLDKLKSGVKLCGHSIKTFDVPYITRRGMANGLKPHTLVDLSGLKPWELDWILDTKDLAQMCGFDRPSLVALCVAYGIPSPKDDISGKDVPKLYWTNPAGTIDRISEYCEKDVDRTYQVLKFLQNPSEVATTHVKTPFIVSLFEGSAYGAEEKEKLKGILGSFSEDEREKAYVILNAMCSNAKGKKTAIQKKDITVIKKELNGK